jgi:GTP cyclohydrolase I
VSQAEILHDAPTEHRWAPHLHIEATPRIDLEAATAAVGDLLVALGLDPDRDELRETPQRVAAAFAELLTPRPFTMTVFPNEDGYHETVLVRDVPVQSLCAHHLLPFSGVAHVAYVPDESIVGLSKLARTVEHFARRPQTQERLTRQIADAIDATLAPRGVAVVIEATHACMELRGVRARGATTVTSAMTGVLDDASKRSELLAVTGVDRR